MARTGGARPELHREAAHALDEAWVTERRLDEADLAKHFPGYVSIFSNPPPGAKVLLPGSRGIGLMRVCDQLPVTMYLADDPPKPSATAAIKEYWEWRKSHTPPEGGLCFVNDWEMHTAVGYVERLAKVLSEPQESSE